MVQLRDDVVGLDAAILGPPAVWEASRPPGQLHRPARRLHATARSASGSTSSTTPTPARTAAAKDSFTEAAPVQPDVQDLRRPGRGRRRRGLPAARDGAGHVRQLHQRAADHRARSRRSASPRSASRSATRSRRATSSSAPASSSRWRWSSSCRPPTAQQWYEYWCQERFDWYVDLGIPADMLRLRPHDADELSHYSSGTVRRGVPVPLGLGRARGHRQPRRLRPHAARQALGREARVLRPGHQRALRAARDRAGRRRHPHDVALPPRRLRRGRGRTARPAPCCASTPASRRTRWPCCPLSQEGHAHAARPRGVRHARAARACATTTRRRPSAAATAARTRSARRVRHGRLRHAGGPRGHHPRPRHHGAGPSADRRSARSSAARKLD